MIFERLFGDVDTSLDAATRARRERYRKSLLDMARDETQKLSGTLGASDRRKVDEYLDSIREMERRIEKAETDGRNIAPTIDKPAGIPAVYADHAKLLFDLQFVAFQTDLTRVTTMVMGREGSVRTYDEIGVSEPHHPLSHHRNVPEALEKLTKINTFHVELFAQFIARLQADAGWRWHAARSFDDSLRLRHRRQQPAHSREAADSGDGRRQRKPSQPGRHMAIEKDTPVANLFLAMMNRTGVRRDAFGDSTGSSEI